MNFAAELLSKYFESIIADLPDDLQDMADELTEVACYHDVAKWGVQAPPAK